MSWNLTEDLDHYRRQGAPADQNALVSLLMELQQAHGGSIPRHLFSHIAAAYGTKETLLLALVRRIPRLRLSDTHILEVCARPGCGKAAALAAAAEQLAAAHPGKISLKFVPCMRMCGRGPNLRWDGRLYSQAEPELLHRLPMD